ncbi:MAG: sulfurtransferase-like selenium metabolism protein YedF [Candidatus Methylomirabilota bacterium]
MSTIVDARGLACPQPVIRTRKALQAGGAVTTIVDSEISRQNVTRMAEKAGYRVLVERREDGIYLDIRQPETPGLPSGAPAAVAPAGGTLVLLVSSETMGRGDEPLGGILIRGFFHALGEVQPLPDIIIFLNSGVKLAAAGSPVLDDLRALAERGVAILSCGTCLGHFGLKEQCAVGEISNMYAIAETLLGAGKVVNL